MPVAFDSAVLANRYSPNCCAGAKDAGRSDGVPAGRGGQQTRRTFQQAIAMHPAAAAAAVACRCAVPFPTAEVLNLLAAHRIACTARLKSWSLPVDSTAWGQEACIQQVGHRRSALCIQHASGAARVCKLASCRPSAHQREEVARALPCLVKPVVAAAMLQAGAATVALADPEVPGVVPSMIQQPVSGGRRLEMRTTSGRWRPRRRRRRRHTCAACSAACLGKRHPAASPEADAEHCK